MKKRIYITLVAVSILTISFTFSDSTDPIEKTTESQKIGQTSEPVGGFVSDDFKK